MSSPSYKIKSSQLVIKASLLIVLQSMIWIGCGTSSSNTRRKATPRGFIQMNVTPKAARVYVDGRFQGQIKGWMHQTVPVSPGLRRVELKARGYITQRFDLDIQEGEILTLTLRMERQLDELTLPKPKRRSRTRIN